MAYFSFTFRSSYFDCFHEKDAFPPCCRKLNECNYKRKVTVDGFSSKRVNTSESEMFSLHFISSKREKDSAAMADACIKG
mmetsp:Transcript_3069/g.4079  ORF Transcript_3069/g.4079 Transcript_3069/m.4079 type:complete len:80 (+) Transcript_3069:1159-1398(+)